MYKGFNVRSVNLLCKQMCTVPVHTLDTYCIEHVALPCKTNKAQ